MPIVSLSGILQRAHTTFKRPYDQEKLPEAGAGTLEACTCLAYAWPTSGAHRKEHFVTPALSILEHSMKETKESHLKRQNWAGLASVAHKG